MTNDIIYDFQYLLCGNINLSVRQKVMRPNRGVSHDFQYILHIYNNQYNNYFEYQRYVI